MAKVISVNISKEKGTVKTPVPTADCRIDTGLVGDAHSGNWHRQISLLANESIDIMRNQGVQDLTPGKFAENITTEGIALHTLPVGTRLRIGETVQEVTQIGKECHQHCEIYHQIGMCVMPTHGIFTRVLEGGLIRPGDEIHIVEE